MQIIRECPNESGAYHPIQSWAGATPPDGYCQISDNCDISAMQTHAGFVTLTVEDGVVTAITGDDAAYQAWLASQQPDLSTLRTAKLDELNAAAQSAITAGCDVTLTDDTTGHISLTPEDQINLTTAQAAVQGGASGYPYHLDGQLCKIYTAADILTMGKAAVAHILYHTTYCNHLRAWAQRAETADELAAITYGAMLPDDLKANMEAIINAASA